MSEVNLGSVKVVLAAEPAASISEGMPTSFQTETFPSVDRAAARAPFELIRPQSVLPGHVLLDAAVITQPTAAAALTYVEKATGRHYIVVQSPISSSDADGAFEVRAIGESIAASTVGSHDAAMVVGGSPAGTPNPMTLLWAHGSLLIQVTGVGYEVSELEAVAAAL